MLKQLCALRPRKRGLCSLKLSAADSPVFSWSTLSNFGDAEVYDSLENWAAEVPLQMSSRGVEAVREVTVLSSAKVESMTFGAATPKVPDRTVCQAQLACSYDDGELCKMLLIKDVISQSRTRRCRIVFKQEVQTWLTKSVAETSFETTQSAGPIFVCVSWPSARNWLHFSRMHDPVLAEMGEGQRPWCGDAPSGRVGGR